MKIATKRKKSHAGAPGTPTVVARAVNRTREENVLHLSRSNIDEDSKKSDCATLKTCLITF